MRNWQGFALAPGVEFSHATAGTAQFSAGPRVLRIAGLGPGTVAALGMLGPEPQALAGLEAADRANGALHAILLRLCGQGLATLACFADDTVLAVATAIGGFAPRWTFGPLDPAEELRLSRLAWCARRGSELVLEAAAAGVRVAVEAPEVAFIAAAFAAPARPGDVLARAAEGDGSKTRACVEFLTGLGILLPAAPDGATSEDIDPELVTREVPDVAVQLASRKGFAPGPIGATFRFKHTLDPEPAVRDWPGRPETALPKPDLDACRTAGKSLQKLVEDRRSRRAFGPAPVTFGQLGEFLFRVARVYQTWEQPGVPHQISARPYPSGGACHDVEFYLAVRRCAGLPPGVYHYHPVRHALALVTAEANLVTAFHAGAIQASAGGAPDVVIILASRFARNAWKYQGLALTIGLKNIGVIMELMYLTAADMGLACCALGDGDSAVFAKATGLHPLAESSMGEFMLGTMTPDDSP
jgi:oxazoline/thiazoline dehydrogenase